jgi:hypothetical protein
MIPDLHGWLHACGLLKSEADYRADVRAFLGRFVKGAPVQKDEDLKLLRPHDRDLWALRFRGEPQSRILGGLVYKDCFVGTHWSFRCNLGRKDSKGWLAAEQRAIDVWDGLLPGIRRFRCHPFSNCVSGAFE